MCTYSIFRIKFDALLYSIKFAEEVEVDDEDDDDDDEDLAATFSEDIVAVRRSLLLSLDCGRERNCSTIIITSDGEPAVRHPAR